MGSLWTRVGSEGRHGEKVLVEESWKWRKNLMLGTANIMRIVIIGNGVSGITAARHIRKLSDHEIRVISSETDYFFSRTALMYVYMGHMRWRDIEPYERSFWKKNRIELVKDHIIRIDPSAKKVFGRSGESFAYDHLILALGSKSNKFGWPGQDLKGVTGLYSKQDLETMEKFSNGLSRAVVVGGGLIGIEMGEMFHSRKIPVTMLVREEEYWDNVLPKEEASMISRHILRHGIDLRLESNLERIIDDGHGQVAGVTVKETGEEIPCGFVGLTPGVSPNIDWIKKTPIETGKGILVDVFLRTNVDGIWAIGDCAQLRAPTLGRSDIEAVWYTGRMMGETVAHTICGNEMPYEPGIWYNSAKFMDIEYQVYGMVPNRPDPDLSSLLWQDEERDRLIRIVFEKESMIVRGVNLLGVRFRHEVCDRWLRLESDLEMVVQQLPLAHFDPEFFRQPYDNVRKIYEQMHGKKPPRLSRHTPDKVYQFLNPDPIS